MQTGQDARVTLTTKDGAVHTLWYNTRAQVLLQESLDKSEMDAMSARLNEKNPTMRTLHVRDWVILVWIGLEGARMRLAPDKPPFTEDDAADLIDDCGGTIGLLTSHGEAIGLAMQAGLGVDPNSPPPPAGTGRRTRPAPRGKTPSARRSGRA